MTCRRSSLLLLAIAALFLAPTLALAAPPAPQPAVVPVAQFLPTLATAAPACQGTADLVLSPAAQAVPADDTSLLCGACSDAACVGKSPNAVCGAGGLRCISGGPSCSTTSPFRCRCLPIS